MVELRAVIDPSFGRRVLRLARMFPRECAQANGRAASTVQRKLRAVMRAGGGRDNVPAFAPLAPVSRALRPGRTLGGALADPRRIVKWRKGGAQRIGWAGGLEGYAARWQRAEERPTDRDERYHLYRRLGRLRDLVPRIYSRPARDVIEPLAHGVARQYPGWILRNLEKLIDRTLTRRGM